MKQRKTSFRKLGGLALALALCLGVLPATAIAAEPEVDRWTDYADTSWYEEAGENATEYHISTAEELAGLAKLVNADFDPWAARVLFDGKTIYLDADIDLAGHEWVSIGRGATNYSFQGTFDGQGHVISNLTSHEEMYTEAGTANQPGMYAGLFGQVYEATIRNLGVVNADIILSNSSSRYNVTAGILVDVLCESTISNCYTSGTLTGNSDETGSDVYKMLGGLAGATDRNCAISNCYSTATIIPQSTKETTTDFVGGLVGFAWCESSSLTGSLTISNSLFVGEIDVRSYQAGVGGIIGYSQNNGTGGTALTNCVVATTAIGEQPEDSGNTYWIGSNVDVEGYTMTVTNCIWPTDTQYDVTSSDVTATGFASDDFNGNAVLDVLNGTSGETRWAFGKDGHPVLSWNTSDLGVPVDSVTLNENNLSLTVGDTTTLTAIVTPDDATNKTVTWTSSDPSVATVDANGLVTAVAPGTATITATADGVSATCTVTVTRPYTPPANPNYRIDITDTANGTVIADPTSAKAGTTVTLTPVPDEGYALGSLAVTDRFGDPVALTEQADGTYTFTMPNGQVTVSATFVEVEEPAAEPFTDVDESDWFYEDVAYVYENGLMNGVGEGLFGPGGTTTRAMVVTILYRLEGEPTVTGDIPFTDLVAGQYYLDAVAWASANDIVNGVTSTTFAPNDPITREQMAAILYRYAQYKGMDTTDRGNLGSFADGNTVSPYAVEAMAWANAEGLVNGVENNRLNPTGQAFRSQVAAILHRFCTME